LLQRRNDGLEPVAAFLARAGLAGHRASDPALRLFAVADIDALATLTRLGGDPVEHPVPW
jgi:hypothetical protein